MKFEGSCIAVKEKISDPEEDRVRYPSRVCEDDDPEGYNMKDNLKGEIISRNDTVLTIDTVLSSLAI